MLARCCSCVVESEQLEGAQGEIGEWACLSTASLIQNQNRWHRSNKDASLWVRCTGVVPPFFFFSLISEQMVSNEAFYSGQTPSYSASKCGWWRLQHCLARQRIEAGAKDSWAKSVRQWSHSGATTQEKGGKNPDLWLAEKGYHFLCGVALEVFPM